MLKYKILKKSFWWTYVFPVLLGTLVGMLAGWAFENFLAMPTSYFVRLFFKSIMIPIITVVILNQYIKKLE